MTASQYASNSDDPMRNETGGGFPVQVQWEQPEDQYRITKTECQVHTGECTITWHWPKDVDSVYIYSFRDGAEQPPDQLDTKRLKLFTREEYKAKTGYRERAEYIGVQGYRIFPNLIRAGKPVPLKQADEGNLVRVSGAKAKIRYAVKYGSKWLSKYKTVRIQLFCEIQVPKEALCYVKKEGAAPANKEDGIAYPFMNDFAPGRHDLPEVEIGKFDFIRLFFTDGKASGEMYELLPE